MKDVLIDARQTFMSKKAEEEQSSKFELERFNKLWDNIPPATPPNRNESYLEGRPSNIPNCQMEATYTASSYPTEEGGFIV